MNKLVIVGNGFDIAHGLPTSYKNFIDNFWSKIREIKSNESLFYFDSNSDLLNFLNDSVKNYKDFREQIGSYCYLRPYQIYDEGNILEIRSYSGEKIFQLKNEFLKIISEISINNWLDIELKYYEILKSLTPNNNLVAYRYTKNIRELNNEFKMVKDLLENYLIEEIKGKYDFDSRPENIDSVLNFFEILNQDFRKSFPQEFPHEDHGEINNFYDDIHFKMTKQNVSISREILFLDFNYTPTLINYIKEINLNQYLYGTAKLIKIHGEANSSYNPINFGFGDEKDDDYKIIEKQQNDFLEYMKSFQYLYNSNYRQLLNWIASNKFQVFIFGHSCGITDRTLLNTIFENENCRSIKIFYHQRTESDNFKELTQNISRHFDNKKIMRDKLVDKSVCKKLPQNIRFKKR